MARCKKQHAYKKKYALVADGETEHWYIKQLVEYHQLNIEVSPRIPQSKTLKEQYILVGELYKDNTYSKILWIIDLDSVLKENNDSKQKGKALSEFKTLYRNALSKWNDKVTIIVNNPCLEYWYCIHNNPNMATFFDSYEKMLPTLRKYNVNKQLFAQYNKSKKDDYLSGIGLYRNLLDDLKKLFKTKTKKDSGEIDFSKFRSFNPDTCESEGCSEMWKLFQFFHLQP